ncbi:MAG TPA: L,D-transpeptidase, partial [Geobacteraceae bacterium]
EQFLGAYEYGELVFSFPIASGNQENRTPIGDFRINAYHRRHQSSLYRIEKKEIPYPMHYGLRFYTNREGVDFWLHGRDVPGYPQSHGCIGLYDEEMQKRFYHYPSQPLLMDARTLYQWAIAPLQDSDDLTELNDGPRVRIIGESFL